MIKYFLQHPDKSITVSDCAITENEIESFPFDVTEQDSAAVLGGTKDWMISGKIVSTIPSTRKADADKLVADQQKAAEAVETEKALLKDKMINGTATLDDIKEALKHIL